MMKPFQSCCACFIALVFAQLAPAATSNWNSIVGGSFTIPGNWTGGVVPTSADRAAFALGAAASYSVTFPGKINLPLPVYAFDQLRVGSNTVSFSDFTNFGLWTPGTVSVTNPATNDTDRSIIIGDVAGEAAVLNTTLKNFSGIAATIGNAVGSSGTLNVNGGTLALTGVPSKVALYVGFLGTGALNVTGGAKVNVAGTYGEARISGGNSSGAATVSGPGSLWTISNVLEVGTGGVGTLTVTNSGQVISKSLSVCIFGTGILSVTQGGQVNITADSSLGGPFGTTGTASVDGSGSEWISGGNLHLGGSNTTLTITNGGHVSNAIGQSDSLSSGGATATVTVDGAGSMWTNTDNVLIGGYGSGKLVIRNGGEVTVAGGAGTVDLAVQPNSQGVLSIGAGGAPGTIDAAEIKGGAGAASVVFNHADASYKFAPLLTGRVGVSHVGSGITVLTSAANYTGATLVSSGTLVVEQGLGGGGNVTVSGGSLDVTGGLTADGGTVRLENGTINADAISLAGGGVFQFLGGALHADTFTGNMTNQGGKLAPGHSAGSTTIVGNYTQQAAGILEIEIGGLLVASQYDFVNITGVASVQGSQLNLAMLGGYTPASSASFTVLNAGSLLGFFSNVTDGQRLATVDGLGSFLVRYGPTSPFNPNQIVLTSFAPIALLAADFNSDDNVDAADLALWQGGFGTGTTRLEGDADDDHDVDGRDFLVWQRQFGSSAPLPIAGLAVPEPTTLIIFLFAAVGLFSTSLGPRRPRAERRTAVALALTAMGWAYTNTAVADVQYNSIALSGAGGTSLGLGPNLGSGVNFSGFGFPAINASGEVAFHGIVSGTGVDTLNNLGIFTNVGGTLGVVARTGAAGPGPNLGSGVNFSSVSEPVLNASGEVAFFGGLTGFGADGTFDSGIFSNAGGTLITLCAKPSRGPDQTSAWTSTSAHSTPRCLTIPARWRSLAS